MSAISAGAAAPAFAQEVATELEVVVTGSRIKASPNVEGTTPVTQVTSEDVAKQGVTRIEDLVNQLPQAFAAQNSTVSNGADGTATVSLRGLGSQRTLVLIDGRRMVYGSSNNSAADLNTIPSSMVERVEVLTGGASAVYGSDAVAGVVNFIMKKDFEGVQIDGQYSFYQHNNSYGGPGDPKLREVIAARAATNPAQFKLPDNNVTDGYGKQINVMIGVNSPDGKGNLTAYIGAQDIDPVLQANRDYSACSLDTIVSPTVQFRCGGSSTSYPGRFRGSFGSLTVDQDSAGNPTFRNFSTSLDQYNFGPLNYYQRPERRYNLGAMGHYEINEHADVYTQLMFNDYQSVAQIAPGGAFFGEQLFNISCTSPLLSAQQLTRIGCPGGDGGGGSVGMYIGRRNVEGGGRRYTFDNSSYRIVAGVRGEINAAWDYDVAAQYSRTNNQETTLNNFVKDRIARSLDVVAGEGGTLTCRSVLDGTDPLCVPYEVFRIGGPSQAALDYLQVAALKVAQLQQEIYTGTVSGDLGVYGWKLPAATDGVQVVFGTEYRRDSLSSETDALLKTQALSGSGGAEIGITGAAIVKELFFEGRLPIAQGKSMAESLSLDAAYRYSDYGSGVTTNTYKIGGEWAPVQDVRFRASYQKAVRAANIIELFFAQGFNLFDMAGDPCGSTERDPEATDAECIATGVPAAAMVPDSDASLFLDSPAGQYQFLQGGNPDLQPEDSDTVSFGVILQPSFAPGLALSIDWFNIKVDGTISTFGAEETLKACYRRSDAAACDRINRNPNNGALWVGDGNVEDLNINIGSLETTGIDVNLNYSGLEIGSAGSLGFNLTGTYLDEFITVPDPLNPESAYDCVGYFSSSCGTPYNKWRHHARVDWTTPWNVDVSLTWRYYGAVKGFEMSTDRIDYKFSSYSYFDLAANWGVTEKTAVTLGINNLLDKDPPLNATVGTTGNGNTYPQTYDALGRYIFLRAKVSF